MVKKRTIKPKETKPIHASGKKGDRIKPDGSGPGMSANAQRNKERILEKELQRTLEWVEFTQKAANAGSWDWDMTTGKLHWSGGLYHLFGLSESSGASFEIWRKAMHPDDVCEAEARIYKAIEERQPLGNEYRIVRPGGEIRWISAAGTTMYDESGRPVRMSGICIDVTDRKNAEEALIRSREELEQRVNERTAELSNAYRALVQAGEYNRSLIEASLDPLVTIGRDGRITDVNSATEKATGRTRGELLGSDFSGYFTDPDKAKCSHRLVFEAGAVHDYPLEILHRNGKVTPVIYNASLYRDGNGEVAGVFAAARDMTEILKAQEMQARLASIVESSDDAIIGCDLNRVIKSWNNGARKTFGYTAAEVIGSYVSIIVPPDHREEMDWIVEKLGRGESMVHYETVCLRKDGDRIHVSMTLSPIAEAGGKVTGVSAILRDISERKRVETMLRRAKDNLEDNVRERTAELNRANEQLQGEIAERRRTERELADMLQALERKNSELDQFAYVVSHDLKAPLRAISTLAGFLVGDYASSLDSEGRAQLDLLTGRVRRMHNLIEGILQYSRIGRTKEERTEVDLNDVLMQTIDLLSPPPHIAVVVETPMPVVVCDRTRIGQVFQNLIGNSIKFMDKPSGRITVRHDVDAGFHRFCVADNGPGIEERHFDRIFKIFQTLRTRDELESTGIGLAIVKKIIESYLGSVWVESTPGQGTRLFFTLPQRDNACQSAQN